jgi:hypothetical protein
MVYFQNKNPNLGKFWSVLQWKRLVNFMAIWSILLPLCLCYGHFVYFVVILAYFSRFGMLYQEKSGNPGDSWFDPVYINSRKLKRPPPDFFG